LTPVLAVIETHPVQYHAPVYRMLQQQHGVPVTAIYGSDFSVAGYTDKEFGAAFAWDTDLLSGYSSVFLSRVTQGGAPSFDDVSAGGLRTVLAALRPDAVMIVGYSPRFNRAAWYEAWRAGRPILFRGETSDASDSRSWLKTQGRRAALALAYKSCSRLLFIGRHSQEHFRRMGVAGGRLVFSPYCVDVTPFETDEAARLRLRAATRRELGVSEDQVVVLFSGKLSRRKGVDLLMQAVKGLAPDVRKRIVLAYLGDGALRPGLETLAAQPAPVRAVFLGFQNQRQLSRFYHAADLLSLPSRYNETWGLVVNEALHHGLPCVVSDRVGCMPDLIEPGRTGESFRADSEPDLTRALSNAIALTGRAEIRDACRRKVAGYSVDRAAAGIAEAYHQATAVARQTA
jgi:glycosyltransferase involved in cell wall biosynthesis